MTAEQIYHSIQIDGKERIEMQAQQLIAIIEKHYGGLSFPDYMDSINRIYSLLSIGLGESLIDFLLENGYSYLVETQYLIANIGYFARQNKENNILPTLLQFPSLKGIKEIMGGYVFDSKIGKIQLFPLSRNLPDTPISRFALQQNYYGACHEAIHMYLKENPQGLGITSLIENQFGEKQYHSYLQEEDSIIDFAHNVSMNQADFNRVFRPQELNRIHGWELEQAEKCLTKEDLDPEKCLLLRLALQKQRQ